MLNLLNPLWKYIAGLCLGISLIMGGVVWWQSTQIHRWHAQNDANAAALQAMTTKKDQQKVITQTKIKVVTKTIRAADTEATKVEQAPPAPNCKTKPEVMNADI